MMSCFPTYDAMLLHLWHHASSPKTSCFSTYARPLPTIAFHSSPTKLIPALPHPSGRSAFSFIIKPSFNLRLWVSNAGINFSSSSHFLLLPLPFPVFLFLFLFLFFFHFLGNRSCYLTQAGLEVLICPFSFSDAGLTGVHIWLLDPTPRSQLECLLKINLHLPGFMERYLLIMCTLASSSHFCFCPLML